MTYKKLLYVMGLKFNYIGKSKIITNNCSENLQNYQIELIFLMKNERLVCKLSFWIRGKIEDYREGKIIGIGLVHPCSRISITFQNIITYLNRLIDMPKMVFPETQEEWDELHHISRILAPNRGWGED